MINLFFKIYLSIYLIYFNMLIDIFDVVVDMFDIFWYIWWYSWYILIYLSKYFDIFIETLFGVLHFKHLHKHVPALCLPLLSSSTSSTGSHSPLLGAPRGSVWGPLGCPGAPQTIAPRVATRRAVVLGPPWVLLGAPWGLPGALLGRLRLPRVYREKL